MFTEVNNEQEQKFLYLTTKGWKTGREHRIEIWFVLYGDKHYIMSEGKEKAHWVQNILHNSRVMFTVNCKSFEGIAQAALDVCSELVIISTDLDEVSTIQF